jgi:hypothetical protein
MKKLALSLAAGGVALLASPVASFAQAADTVVTREYYAQGAPIVENSRTMCDQFGRCWRERTRTIVESYNYAPRPPAVVEQRVYDERPAYYVERPATVYREAPAYYDAPSAGIGVTVPGATLGVGLNTW